MTMENEDSAKTTLRLPKDVLMNAKIYAKNESLSLNQYVLSALISAIFNSKKALEKKKQSQKADKKKKKNPLDVYLRR